MAPVNVFALVAMTSAALCGAFVVCVFASLLSDGMRSSWVQRRAGAGGVVDRALMGGFPPLMPIASFLLRFGFLKSLFSRHVRALGVKGRASDCQSVCSLACVAFIALIIFGWMMGSPFAGAAFALSFIVGLSAWANHVLEANRDEVRESLPDAIRAMSSCFHAGFSLQQTFRQLSEELKGPIATVFSKAKDAMDTGSSAEDALDLIRSSESVPELSFIAVALEVQHRAGGSLKHVLDAACESLEGELELRRSLKVQTAQARLSARVVTGVTIALVGLLSLLTEGFLDPFFSSALGFSMLLCAIGMQVAGVFVVRRLLKVEVD